MIKHHKSFVKTHSINICVYIYAYNMRITWSHGMACGMCVLCTAIQISLMAQLALARAPLPLYRLSGLERAWNRS